MIQWEPGIISRYDKLVSWPVKWSSLLLTNENARIRSGDYIAYQMPGGVYLI